MGNVSEALSRWLCETSFSKLSLPATNMWKYINTNITLELPVHFEALKVYPLVHHRMFSYILGLRCLVKHKLSQNIFPLPVQFHQIWILQSTEGIF